MEEKSELIDHLEDFLIMAVIFVWGLVLGYAICNNSGQAPITDPQEIKITADLSFVTFDPVLNGTVPLVYHIEQNPLEPVTEPGSEIEDTVDPLQLDMLSRLIYWEVGRGSSNYRKCYLCGSVVLNRMLDDHYPDTMEEVIFQKRQYAVAKHLYREPENEDRFQFCQNVAEDLLRNGTDTPENLLYQAMFRQGSQVYEKIDGEYFCLR